jgi:MoCo/4Fe-4S cofactor protein with predicted Tat translocation signal
MRSAGRLSALNERLRTTRGRDFWRSLEELARSPGFVDLLREEFPQHAHALNDGVARRDFLKLMAASLAFAGFGGCTRQPEEHVVPYVRQPERLVVGEPLQFATAMPSEGFAIGLLVESHDGRPTKIEGNPSHPASLGSTDAMTQASLLTLYDPDRAQVITSAGAIRTWTALGDSLREAVAVQRARRGVGLRILTETVTSPSLAQEIRSLLDALPEARWHQFEPAGRNNARLGSRLAFGEDIETSYQLDRADVIVTLDADIFGTAPGRLRYIRDVARRRRLERGRATMNRLYAVESTTALTGASADHRLPLRATELEDFTRALAIAVGVKVRPPRKGARITAWERWIAGVAKDLRASRGSSVVIAGDGQPPIVHAMAHVMNEALGNVGQTIVYTAPVEAEPTDHVTSLRDLVADMDRGAVELLLILGGNPVYTAPVDLEFGRRLREVPLRVHLSLYEDETSELCQWHVPQAHYLEAWDDVRAFDGTATILQPLIAPLYDGKTPAELVAACSEGPARSSYDIVRTHWERERGATDFESFWRESLHDGLVKGTALQPKRVRLRDGLDSGTRRPLDQTGLEIVFRADPNVGDGRFANSGWLQELPKPITQLTWDNAALIAPATATQLGLASEDVVELRHQERVVRAPVLVVPGHPTDAVTVHLGYGRRRAGRVGNAVGFDAYRLRTLRALDFAADLTLRKTGERHRLAITQEHHSMEGRAPVRAATLAEYRDHPDFAHEHEHGSAKDLSLYPSVPYEGYAWGMTIDLTTCIGCNACTAACQAENNIPVVGKDQVLRGREMHWIRVDRYYTGAPDNPAILHQPVPCMHCENAPCEVVCPVNATVHSSEGLNEMVYNRCVGTRYCSNNCPYKVRRFNFYLYTNWSDETVKMAMNPDVTVRSRGVMEKCTYCVQRIERTRIDAQREGRRIRDGELVTACQQVCPAEAIVFGDTNDERSQVAELKTEPRNYALLADRNTQPRTTYLAAVHNPNPDLEDPETGETT